MADNERVSAKRWVVVAVVPILISVIMGFAKTDSRLDTAERDLLLKADKVDIEYIKAQIVVIRDDQRKILERIDRHIEAHE